MIDESLLKSNFLGRDGFRWWIGQIPPESAHSTQIDKGGWGNRFKVRILGYHPYSEVELPNEDLPWAQVLLSTTSGSGAGNNATSVKISPGDVVFGFFLDGDSGQIPVITGIFGRTSQVPSKDYKGAFQPFTGYTTKIKKPNGTLKPDQSNEQNALSQKSPRNVAPKQAPGIGADEIPYYTATGDVIQVGTQSTSKIFDKISTEVNNLLNKIQNGINIAQNLTTEISRVVDKIQGITSGLVGSMVNSLYKAIAPLLNQGLKALYRAVFAAVFAATKERNVAHRAGVAAQTAMVPPIKNLQCQIPCITNSIINSLGSVIAKILNSVIGNVTNFVSCAGDQFAGSLINDIIQKITSGLKSAIGGVSKILRFVSGFSVEGILRNSVKGIAGIADLLACSQNAFNAQSQVNQWVIGSGPKNNPAISFDKILQNANIANSLAQSAITAGTPLDGIQGVVGQFDIFGSGTKVYGSTSPLGGCYTGPRTKCTAPAVNIFGSNGSGATAIPLFGSIVGEDSNKTGSVIAVKVTNSGSGYDFPPFVEIVDECGQGYGAVARSVLNDNGGVEYIYIVSEGENYPIGEMNPYTVNNIVIIDSGSNYNKNDLAFDQFGNKYKINVLDGSIIKVQPLNNPDITDLPIITVESETGSGALLKPIIDVKKRTGKEKVSQVIDCIT